MAVLILDNRKAFGTFGQDTNGEMEDEKDDGTGPGFELCGDVAVYRDGAESKLGGLLRVQSTKISKDEDSSTRTGSSRVLTMTELQKRADGFFSTISRVNSTADSKTPVYLTGHQLIQPSKSADLTRERNSSNLGVQSQESIRSRKEQKMLLEKYLGEIQNFKGAPDQVATIQILADEGGIVGYVEGLKKKGLVKETFQVPSISRGSKLYGDPSLKLSNDDLSVNPLQIPPPRVPTTSRHKDGIESGFDESMETSLAPGKFTTEESIPPAGETAAENSQVDLERQHRKAKPKLSREFSLPEGRINLFLDRQFESLTRLSTSEGFGSFRSLAPSLRQRSKEGSPKRNSVPWERYSTGNDGEEIGTVVTGYRLSRVNEDESWEHVDRSKIPYEKKIGFNSQRTLPSSTSPLRTRARKRSKTFDEINTNTTTTTRKISVPRSDISATDETASDSTRSSFQFPKNYNRKRFESLKSELKSDADEFGRKVTTEIKQKTAELEEERRKAASELARQRRLEADRLRQIAATGFIQKAFYIDKTRKKKLAKASKIIQSWVRGFLLRKRLKDVKKQATLYYGGFNKFYKQYFILMRKIQNFYGAAESDINPSMKELKAYITKRQEYDASIKKVIGHRNTYLRPPQLEMALNRLDKYPCSQEIQRAILQTYEPVDDSSYEPYSCFLKITVKEALDACFFIYVPKNIGLKPSELRISSWMAPIVDGIEVKKFLSNPNFFPEATVPYKKCVEAVMQIMFEQDLKPIDEMFGPGALQKITEKRQKTRNIVV